MNECMNEPLLQQQNTPQVESTAVMDAWSDRGGEVKTEAAEECIRQPADPRINSGLEMTLQFIPKDFISHMHCEKPPSRKDETE